MKFGSFDSHQIIIQNINLFPNKFEDINQWFYYIENLSSKLTEQNINKCITSFLNFSNIINSNELERPQFALFIDILDNHFNILTEKKILMDVALFSDLYCVDN